MANKKLVYLLLQDENANVANEEFETLSGRDWVRLLLKKPQFSERCEWHKLTCQNWANLLKKQPQFADKCDKWDDMDKDKVFSGLKIWRRTLTRQPQLAKFFNKNNN